MDRRDFVKGTLLTGMAAPALIRPETAWANIEEDEDSGNPVAEWQRVSLFLGTSGQIVLLAAIFVIVGQQFLYYNMQRNWQRFAASRANVSKLPLLGGLTRPTIQQRLARMDQIGNILLLNTTLFIVANALNRIRLERMTIANAGNEFTTGVDPRVVKAIDTRDKINANLKRARDVAVLGAHYDEKTGELLALIPPEYRSR